MAAMRIPLDRTGTVPVYRQIAGWLRQDIESGGLPADTRLPATRALAAELGVSRITVVNAYAELEDLGLVLGREGSGTYVVPRGAVPPRAGTQRGWPQWQRALDPAPRRPAPPDPPPPGTLAFTGVGDPRLFPVAALARTYAEVLRSEGAAALEYGRLDTGWAPLRETISGVLASQGIRAAPDQVLVTTGSQQALALTVQVLLRPGDAVVVEEPTYDLALDLFRAAGARIVPVPVDGAGMQVERLEPLLAAHRPKLVYTIPDFQNPTGASMSTARRHRLVALAERHDVAVVEDDYVGDLRYEGRSAPAVKALDRRGQVVYLGTFSKTLMPGLRVGYLVAEGPVFARLAFHKQVQDLTTAPLTQRVLDRYVTVGRYQAHLRRTTRHYRRRRDALAVALRDLLPEVAATSPRGGLFTWLTLPDGVSARALLAAARREGVDFAPGGRFFAAPADGDRFARLNFATLTPEEIGVGVRRLRAALDRVLGSPP